MPNVAIHMREGRSREERRAIGQVIHEALVARFKIPAKDRFQRVLQYAESDFDIPPSGGPGFLVIEMDVFPGRAQDTKRALYRDIVEGLGKLGVAPNDVFIILKEPPLENWGIRGGQAACDVDLGYKVDV